MARERKAPIQTKKHLARQEREQIQRRYIMIGTVVVLALVVGLVLFGILNETVFKAREPVAIVNGDNITTESWQKRVRYARQQLVGSAINTYQFVQLFGDSPETQAQIGGQLSQIQAQLEPISMGNSVLDQMIDETLIRQEAELRSLSVSEAEVDTSIEEAFGFFPAGTPTTQPTTEPLPTSTLSPLQERLVPPTATVLPTATNTPTQTATATLEPSVTPTSAPTASPTPYTREGFEQQYQDTLTNFDEAIGFTESDLRDLVRAQLLYEKVQEELLDELAVSRFEQQVWARHILVPEEADALQVLDRLDAGEDWNDLAAELSTDESNKDRGGDLGWFGPGRMVPEFEEAAFALDVGEISQPVQTSFGWHIIQSLGNEERPLTEQLYQQARQQAFSDWLQDLRANSEIEIMDNWIDKVPTEPVLPQEIQLFIQQSQSQPALPSDLPVPSSE